MGNMLCGFFLNDNIYYCHANPKIGFTASQDASFSALFQSLVEECGCKKMFLLQFSLVHARVLKVVHSWNQRVLVELSLETTAANFVPAFGIE